ncbi:MAG: peptidylprolyl isomerase [Stenomitos rutilans HA7619-LM2]|jgi:parvulin-like peptidyl-prolyl isomerase|nr:peptidylprolyl isomerase [Stenomitos rutilans HA7619-LM2]
MTNELQIGKQTITGSDILPLLSNYLLLPSLKREVLIDQAIADIECTPEELNSAYQQFCQRYQISSEASLQTWMTHYSITSQQLKTVVARYAKIEKFKQVAWGQTLEAYFFNRKGQFDKVIYSLLRVQDAGAAQEFYFRIQAGEQSFSELAREHSQGPESRTGGVVGPLTVSALHPTMAKILSRSQPGQLRTPTQIDQWFVLLRLEKFMPAELDESMRYRLLNEQFDQWLENQLQTLSAPVNTSTAPATAY